VQGRFGMVLLDWLGAAQGTECFDQLAKMNSNTHGLETLIVKIPSSGPFLLLQPFAQLALAHPPLPANFEGRELPLADHPLQRSSRNLKQAGCF